MRACSACDVNCRFAAASLRYARAVSALERMPAFFRTRNGMRGDPRYLVPPLEHEQGFREIETGDGGRLGVRRT
jgi:hypothetical protein